jgi:hypothetical protein
MLLLLCIHLYFQLQISPQKWSDNYLHFRRNSFPFELKLMLFVLTTSFFVPKCWDSVRNSRKIEDPEV